MSQSILTEEDHPGGSLPECGSLPLESSLATFHLWRITRKLFAFPQILLSVKHGHTEYLINCSYSLGLHGLPILCLSHRQDLCSELLRLAKHILMWINVVPQCSRWLGNRHPASIYCKYERESDSWDNKNTLPLSAWGFTVCKACVLWLIAFDYFTNESMFWVIFELRDTKGFGVFKKLLRLISSWVNFMSLSDHEE